MAAAGYEVQLGRPGAADLVGVWGQTPSSKRGLAIASRTSTSVLHVEDAFLRSVHPGRSGSPPLGLHLDHRGVHFDPVFPSDLEVLLASDPLNDPDLLARATAAIARLKRSNLSKYNAFPLDTELPAPGYVLVIDQTRGDASVLASGADAETFRTMLALAHAEHPDRMIVIKTHPETSAGHRFGYYDASDIDARTSLFDRPVSPWAILAGASAVYTLCSQFGFEAILAGHRPVVLGQPFYVGWGLTDDRTPLPILQTRRNRNLTATQLFAAAMILYPCWYDPFRRQRCTLETAIDILEAEVRAWREDHRGWVATGMRTWKRNSLQQVFGHTKAVLFDNSTPTAHPDRRLMVWAGKTTPALHAAQAVQIEDGFLRSHGLGADMIPPLSLVCDDLGIYYDPNRDSQLERLIAASVSLADDQRARAKALIDALLQGKLSKYNLGGVDMPLNLPVGRRILVPGQVEDDASIRLGAGSVRTNLALLQAARDANPDAVIFYKPHPDVEAGLRIGAVPQADKIADVVLRRTDVMAALAVVDEVWTMTSALGFEALLRGKKVVCFGAPFYAGWGLTIDHRPVPRRQSHPDIVALTHATLIDYPRYFDPVTRLACPVEVIVERLAKGQIPRPGPFHRSFIKAQGALASYTHLWR